MVRVVTRTAFWSFATAMFVLVHADGFGTTSLACAAGASVLMLWFAYRETALDDVIAAAAVLPRCCWRAGACRPRPRRWKRSCARCRRTR